jgi:DNA-binding IclR family transcriptional regulator
VAETSKTVSEALRLLAVVAAAPGSIADLTRRMDLSRTVVQRLLTTLQEHGFVLRLPDGRYALGTAVIDLAGRAGTPLRLLATPHLDALAQRLNETVVLTMRQAEEGVSAAQVVAPDRMVRVEFPPGYRHPLHIGAGGRAILLGPDDPGYATSVNEVQPGVAGLAAPVRGADGVAIASVGVIVPVERFADPPALAKPVIATARALSAALATASGTAAGTAPLLQTAGSKERP